MNFGNLNTIETGIDPLYKSNDGLNLNSLHRRSKSYINTKDQFVQKVIIENHSSTEDLMYILDTFLTENNYPVDYSTDNERNKITITFNQEDIAFNFTRKLNLEKLKNPSYTNTKITLTLVQNENYISPKKIIKKRNLPLDSIERLYKGESFISKSNNMKKSRSRIGNVSRLILQNSNNLRGKLYLLYFFILEFGVPYKVGQLSNRKNNNLNLQRIPPLQYKFREVHKERWVSPTNFYA